MIDVDAMLNYLEFVDERHSIWEKRQRGEPGPWTEDPILASRKFTNVFRILDPGSQFILTDLVEPGLEPEDLLLRLFLYRHTGRVESWQYLPLSVGGYPTRENLGETLEAWKEYRGPVTMKKTKTRWAGEETIRISTPRTVFTNAYLVFPQSQEKGTDKLVSIMDLVDRMFVQGDLAERFLSADSQASRYKVLRSNLGVGDFMSMQILTDWGYGPWGEDTEDDFIVPGPGSRKGIAVVCETRDRETFLRYAQGEVHASARCPTLLGRKPSLMDIQNTFCEFSKYDRYLGRELSTEAYRPAHPGPQPAPLIPAHWY